MASGLSRALPAIEQTLHGYNEGHGLIAGSASVDDESAALMLVMSDLAPRQAVGPDGWLVGYPLPHAKRYVIARTWPAPEMPRPGCVWTHSLVLDYAAFSVSGSFEPLIKLLRRPKGEFSSYNIVLPLPSDQPSQLLPPRLFSDARAVLAGLYGTNQVVVREFTSLADAERLVLAVWEQQWPRLRRRFRWTTLDFHESSEIPKFDLVVNIPRDHGTRRVVSRSIRNEERQAWIVASLADLRAGGGLLRSELRQLAFDVESGRQSFSLLVSTILLAKKPVLAPSDAQALLNLMRRRLRPTEAKHAKGRIVAALLRGPSRLEGQSLSLALSLLPTVEEPEALAIARACWRSDQQAFWNLLPTSAVGKAAVDSVLEELPVEDLADVAASPQVDLLLSVTRRPDMLRQPLLWVDANVRIKLVEIVSHNRDLIPDALTGAFAAQDIALAKALISEQGRGPMFSIYMDWERSQGRPDTQRTGFFREWLATAATDSDATVKYLLGEFRLRPSVVTLARLLGPQSFAPPELTDIWAESWDSCAGRPVSQDREYIAAFFLYRCCYYDSRGRSERFAASLSMLLEALEAGLTDPGARALVSDHFARYGMFSLLESDTTRVVRGLARLVAVKRVPIASFVVDGRLRHVDAFLEQLQWQHGAAQVLLDAAHELEGKSISGKRWKLLEQALRWHR